MRVIGIFIAIFLIGLSAADSTTMPFFIGCSVLALVASWLVWELLRPPNY